MGGATGVACVGLNLAFDKNFNVTPFNGGADLLANVLGGHCDAGIFSQSEVVKNIDQLKPIAILTANHSVLSQLTDVPTIAESGYPGISLPGGSFRSFMVKKVHLKPSRSGLPTSRRKRSIPKLSKPS